MMLSFLRHPFFIEQAPEWSEKHAGKWIVGYGWSAVCYTRIKALAYMVLCLYAVYFVILRKVKYGDPMFNWRSNHG